MRTGTGEQSELNPDLGWTRTDSPRKVWGLSHTHLANAIDLFSNWFERAWRRVTGTRGDRRLGGASRGWLSSGNDSN